MIPRGAGNTLVTGDFRGTWRELPPVKLPDVAAVFCATHTDALRAAWCHSTTSRETLIAAAARREPGLVSALSRAGFAIADSCGDDLSVSSSDASRDAVPGRVWLLTSGSTGRPKQVAHTLNSLTTVHGDQPPRTWLCPYTPGAYAWWQVVTLGLSHPQQKIVFVERDRLDDWAELALQNGVDAASGTPTFWRQALLRSSETLTQIRFKQITLGGEPVDQGVLDQLAAVFPEARISWIYASSEAGASITVHDGKAGFPETWLTADPARLDRPAIGVDRDELVIASPYRGEGTAAELHTGDRVEIRDGRVHILGRLASDEINVGGSKASTSAVREVLLAHTGVSWASVKGRRAPLVGAVVQAEVVLSDPDVTEADLTRWCASRLAEYAVPRRFRFLSEIPMKESLKSDV